MGLPEHFQQWRPGQERAIDIITAAGVDSVTVMVQPTGSGKSLTYVGAAWLDGGRGLFLTSTKGLQQQLLAEFEQVGLVEVKGRNAYPCLYTGDTCEGAPCECGLPCEYRNTDCTYYEAIRIARRARFVCTNYAFQVSTLLNAVDEPPLGNFSLLVCDEAHAVPEVLTACLKVELNLRDRIADCMDNYPDTTDCDAWQAYARTAADSITIEMQHERKDIQTGAVVKLGSGMGRLKKLVKMLRRINRIQNINPDGWVITKRIDGYDFSPVDVRQYARPYLFRGGAKILLTSATVRPKTADLLGVTDYKVHEFDHTFPLTIRPVWYIPCVKVWHKWSAQDEKVWLHKITNIVRSRADRKGIIHAVSYTRAKSIAEHLNKELAGSVAVYTNSNGSSTQDTVRRFREHLGAAVFVTPSVTTGYDFPNDQCRYQLIVKLPFPDTRDPLVYARTQRDKSYAPYLTMQTLVQACGRGVRSATDYCETFIIDDNWAWFCRQHEQFAPAWFIRSVKRSNTIPKSVNLNERG